MNDNVIPMNPDQLNDVCIDCCLDAAQRLLNALRSDEATRDERMGLTREVLSVLGYDPEGRCSGCGTRIDADMLKYLTAHVDELDGPVALLEAVESPEDDLHGG